MKGDKMSDLTIKFDSTVPRGAHEEIRALFAPHEAMLREEVREVRISLREGSDPDPEDFQAATMTLGRYHFAVVQLDASFFALTDVEKAQIIAHEAVHVVHDPFAREVQHILQHLVPEAMRAYAANRLSDAEERAVETIAHALYKARGGV